MAANQFNSRSDNAALKLKSELNARNRGVPGWQDLGPSPIAVGPDGQPPAPPPPEGSYARASWDQQQAQLRAEQGAAAQHAQSDMGRGDHGQPTPRQVVGDQPPAGTSEQQSDGSVAPPLAGGQPQPAAPLEQSTNQPFSENANARIQSLIAELREKDHQIAELAASREESTRLRSQVESLQQERDRIMREHLEDLDPETRATILAEARMRELLDQNNRSLLEQLQPQLSTLHQQNQQTEYERLARKYPGFDLQIHPALIEQLRAKVPALTVEMAFKAVAEGDEAVTREHAAHVAVPPVVPAGNGAHLPRYMPEPTPDPNQELMEFQERTFGLIRSDKPEEQRQGYRQLDNLIAERLKGASYEGKPSVFS